MSVNCDIIYEKITTGDKKTLDQVANDKNIITALGMYERGMRNPV